MISYTIYKSNNKYRVKKKYFGGIFSKWVEDSKNNIFETPDAEYAIDFLLMFIASSKRWIRINLYIKNE